MLKALTLFLLVALSLLSPFTGAVEIDLGKIWLQHSLEHQIFFDLRIPRLLSTKKI